MRIIPARRLLAAAVPNVNVNISEAASAANIRNVVRTAYSGNLQGSRLISVAPGASIRTHVPWATWATVTKVAKTHRMATTSQRFGSRLSAARGRWVVGVFIRL